jgi:hypothetical protein
MAKSRDWKCAFFLLCFVELAIIVAEFPVAAILFTEIRTLANL